VPAQDYGGFTGSLPAIDIRFGGPEQIDHFREAWHRPGLVPLLPAEGPLRAELMSIGTIIEHELRHFHDHLLCFESLQASWIRKRMLLNGMPAVTQILTSDEHDVVPFPLLDWATLTERERSRKRASLEALYPAGARRFWSPKKLPTEVSMPAGVVIKRRLSRAEELKFTSLSLQTVRAFGSMLDPLRHGLDPTPLTGGRFTPRFVHEFSALSTQLVAVAKTYGWRECAEFMVTIASDPSIYNRFFLRMLHLFASKGSYGEFDPSEIDFPKMNAVAFWCMTGCPSDDTKGGPATRLSAIINAAEDDWHNVFPSGMGIVDLVDHFDRRFGCEPFRSSVDITQTQLESECSTMLGALRSIPGAAEAHLRGPETFASVLRCRRSLLGTVKSAPEAYIDPVRWMADLTTWPQCPVHLRFSAGRIGVHRDDLRWCGPNAVFNVSTNVPATQAASYAGDVYMPALFDGPAIVPMEPVIDTQQLTLLFDLLLEPDQVSQVNESGIRDFVREQYGKELLRLL
jgi:hypothetical protein